GTSVDCESSTSDNISTCDRPGRSIVFSKRYQGRSTLPRKSPELASRALHLNAMMKDMREMLISSVGSLDRKAYGQLGFLETEFVLTDLVLFLGTLKRKGVADRALADIPSLQKLVKRGLGKLSRVKTVLDLASLTTADLIR